MLQKKICMVGVYGTGKTALVQRYVHSLFSPRYLSTVGVKIDRREVTVDDRTVTLILWDVEGRDEHHDINPSYLRGAHGLIYVVDGTRRETFDQVFEIQDLVRSELGEVPSVIAFNKVDLVEEWRLTPDDDDAVAARGLQRIRTSAKTGEGVDAVFEWLARATVAPEAA
jgi:small GTP-binding protein